MAEVPSDWDPLGQVVGGLSLVFPSSKIILEPGVSSPFLSWFRTLCFFTWALYSQQPPSLQLFPAQFPTGHYRLFLNRVPSLHKTLS